MEAESGGLNPNSRLKPEKQKNNYPDRESYHLEAIVSYASFTSSTELYIFTPKTKKSKSNDQTRKVIVAQYIVERERKRA